MKIHFTKMHGLGNDFVVVDGRNLPQLDSAKLGKKLLNRRTGVGGDQLLLILPSKSSDIEMAIYEQDGARSEMCGNGIRCVGLWLSEREKKKEYSIDTLAGVKKIQFRSSQEITVDMGKPEILASLWGKEIEVLGEKLVLHTVSMGNPHAVIFVSTESELIKKRDTIGPILEKHSWFPNRTNVEFVYPKSKNELIVRVWERGAGATLACGTGACASAVAAIHKGVAQSPVTVSYELGSLRLEWKEGGTVLMTGPGSNVFEGDIEI